jgi:phosphoglycerate dehydrogenase-like enzyme
MYQGPVAVCSRTFSKHPHLREAMKARFSNIRFNDEGLTLSEASLAQFLKESDGAIVALEKVTADVLKQLPRLKVISKYGVGLDNLDLEAFKKFNVQLGWTGGVNRRSVSELTLGFMLDLLRKISHHNHLNKSGHWKNLFGNTLSGKRVGIIGCGFIGKDLVDLLSGFKCEILVNDVLDLNEFCKTKGVRSVPKEKILRTCDVITLHVPYSPETHHLISENQLQMMRPTAILINTSRGNVVDEAALYLALKNGRLAGAALDVFSTEPPQNSPLMSLDNFISTPHVGGSSEEAIMSMGLSAIENLYTLLQGARI